MNTCLYYLLYIASLSYLYFIYSFQFYLLSTFFTRWRFNHLIRFFCIRTILFLSYASHHPQTSTFSHVFWPSSPRTSSFDWLNVELCASIGRGSNRLLLHFIALLWFTAAGCFRFWRRILIPFHEWTKLDLDRMKKEHGRARFEPSTSELIGEY